MSLEKIINSDITKGIGSLAYGVASITLGVHTVNKVRQLSIEALGLGLFKSKA